MIFESNVKSVLCDGVFVVIYFKTMYMYIYIYIYKIIRFGFCDIRNNTYLDLDYFGYHKNLI